MQTDPSRIIKTAIAGTEQQGLRLDQVAASLFPDFSRGQIQKWIRSGELCADGKPRKITYRISGGETISLNALPQVQGEVLPQNIALDVIHADDDLLVINKPAGLVVHPAAGNPDGTMQNALLYLDPGLATLPRSGIVHRLDKDTSGVLVVARSLRAHHSLVKQLQTRSMSRVYEAIALGDSPSKGTIEADIGRHPKDRKRMAVVSSGKPAITHYQRLRRFHGASHMKVSLESGRTHQIRVHMQYIGHPLLGDPVYRAPRNGLKELSPSVIEAINTFSRQALHARKLSLQHPADQRPVSFQAPRPQDLALLLEVLTSETL